MRPVWARALVLPCRALSSAMSGIKSELSGRRSIQADTIFGLVPFGHDGPSACRLTGFRTCFGFSH
jgi:hypothetical protein